jgi:hypothetical protein
MNSHERTELLEELRRAAYPKGHRHPPTFLELFAIVPYEPN